MDTFNNSTIDWDNDTPFSRQNDFIIFFLKMFLFDLIILILLHIVHFSLLFILPWFKKNYEILFSKYYISKLLYILTCCLNCAMILSYLNIFFSIQAIFWSYTTFNTYNRIYIFTICVSIIFLLSLIEFFILPFIAHIWKFKLFSQQLSFSQCITIIKDSVHRFYLSKYKWVVFFFICYSCFAIAFCSISYGLCWPNEPETDFSSTITRILSNYVYGPYCGPNEICFIYLLVPNDLSSQMQIIFHSQEEPTNSIIMYGTSEDNLTMKTEGRIDKLSNFEVDRYISSIVLSNLEPETSYYFKAVMHSKNGIYDSEIRKFRTAPIIDEINESLNFAVASDIGRYDTTLQVGNALASDEPLFLSIGGDLAYENGYETCYCRWDWLLYNFNTMLITPKGFTIPILASIGNHEAGGNNIPIDNIPFFLDYFPYSDSSNNTENYIKTPLYERKFNSLFHSHTFGSNLLQFIVLDSGHCTTRDGIQKDWLINTLNNSQDYKYRIALYHVPLYPSARSFNVKGSELGREIWLPIFDEYKLSLAFENHDHVYKRTYLLKENEINEDGTLYLGDGGWGVITKKGKKDRWYIEKTVSYTNYYMITSITNDWMVASAYDKTKNKIDEVIL